MSLIEIEFMKTNEKYIKYENEPKDDLDAEDSTAVVDTHNTDDSYKARCGEIFVSNSGKFSFSCTFCDERFEEIHTFVDHMQRIHLNIQNQEDVEDPLLIDDDDEQFSDVKSEVASDESNSISNECDTEEKSPTNKNAPRTDSDYLKDFRVFLDRTFYGNQNTDELEEAEDLTSEKSFKSTLNVSLKEGVKNRDFYCETCNRQYATKRGFEQHITRHETADYSDNYFDDFERNDSGTETKPDAKQKKAISHLKCKFCNHQFKDRSRRICHERIHTGEKPFKCDVCEKCFRTKRLLGNHALIHTGERPHKCPYCGAAFTHKMNLIVHIRAHMGDKRFTCEICDKRFVRNVDRRIHMRSHTGEKPYQCEWCGNSFSTSSKLTEHRKRHTNTRPYKCNDCEKSFYSRNLLKNHTVVHSDERPYKCDICFSSFPRKRALQSHLKIHAEVKEYVCSICNKAFAQNAGLYCHMKSHGVRVAKKTPSEIDLDADISAFI